MSNWIDRVRARAKELGLTDAEVARRVGCSKPTFSLWMVGRRNPTLESRMAIASVLGVSIEWLETGAEKEDPNALPYISMEEGLAFLEDREARKQAAQNDSGIRLMESQGDSYLLRMSNDSMIDPGNGSKVGIYPGSTIQIDSDREPAPGNIILIEYHDELLLRVWQPMSKDLHLLTVINPLYQSDLNIKHQGKLTDIFKGTAVAFRRELT